MNVPELFGSMVFNDGEMKKRLTPETYKALKTTVSQGAALSLKLADEIAEAMKEWAIEKGATHFTHWFQPMTGLPAEKHDSFIDPQPGGSVIMTFKGKELIKGEPDASSFPSGGMRATAEARGYTVWDPTSYAFVIGTTLYIPTCFVSFTGEVLDKKTPLLRSMDALSAVATKFAKMFGVDCTRVNCTVGPEQEYFLIDRELYNSRKDLRYTGRTLFGAEPPKGQELEDQYFGSIRTRVMAFMEDVDEQLWKLGVSAKTRHNEVAPAQHELAPVFSSVNIATDHNLLTMEVLKKTAERHGLACLLHEKPFKGVNGSGKHDNWSISTDTGVNLLSPGKDPANNLLFLATVAAVIEAVHKHSDLLRLSVATAGNDHRLGANEAPPAIISMFLGEELQEVLTAIENGETLEAHKKAIMDLGVSLIPKFNKDTTDRNRTSPFAFTGNKFEFRMVGSAASVAGPNTILNTIVANSLSDFYEELESSDDLIKDVMQLVKKTVKEHKRIIFNGNGYSKEWEEEAERRGLYNLKSTPEALSKMLDEKNIKLFEKFGVYTKGEMEARYEIYMENYCTVISIEALTMIDLIKKQVMPAVMDYEKTLIDLITGKQAVSVSDKMESALLEKISKLADAMYVKLEALEDAMLLVKNCKDTQETGMYYKDKVFLGMQELRAVVDELETLVAAEYWPLPTYAQMLYSVI